MKFPDFAYARPGDLDGALALLAEHGDEARILGGGQSLMPMLAMRVAEASVLVDVTRLAELSGITEEDGRVRIGAATRYVELLRAPLIAEKLPLLGLALPHVAHVAIRNRGTIGGSLALADPAAEMPACMLALDAEIELASAGGRRRVAASDYFLGLYETARRDDEILVAVRVPVAAPNRRFGFAELARRRGDFALAGAAVAADVEGDTVRAPRVVLFGCADRPVLAGSVMAVIEGRSLGADTRAAAVDAMSSDIEIDDSVHGDAESRMHQARTILGRALAMLETSR